MVDGQRYTFDVYGLYNGLFVMADRQTGSVWTHYDGTVLTGPLTQSEIRLEIQPLLHMTWADWRTRYPETIVVDWIDKLADRYRDIEPGQAGLGPRFQRTILNWDERLPENELVLGVNIGDEFRAYVLSEFTSGLSVVNDTLNDYPVVIIVDPAADYALAFRSEVDGQRLTFEPDKAGIRDQSGSIWDLTGKAISGPSTGSQLPYVTSFITEWYGWAAYHPETGIYGQQ